MFAIAASHRQICRLLTFALISSAFVWHGRQLTALADHQQRVLVIHSYHDHLPWTDGLRQGITQGFQEQRGEINIYHEFLDAKRLPGLLHGDAFLAQLSLKYSEPSLDLLMVSDDPGLRLVLKHRADYFSELPIVYLGINTIDPALLKTPNATGVFEVHSMVDTVLGALEQTNAQKIVVINDSTETGQANLDSLQALKEHLNVPNQITILNDVVDIEVSQILSDYPSDCPILVLGQLRQESTDGPLVSFKETAEVLSATLPNPLYAVSTTFLGHGVVGGKVLDPEYHAAQAVELAHQVLAQSTAEGVEPITVAKTRWVFDHRELLRLGIRQSDLPKDSKVIHHKLSFYSQYRQLVWATVGTLMTALLIIVLLMELIRRRSLEEQLLRENEKRYRDLAEAGANVFWELNQHAEFTYISDEAIALCAQPSAQLVGRSLHAIVSHDEDLEFNWGEFLQAFYTHQPIQDFIFRRRSGADGVRIFKINGKPMFDTQNNFLGYRGIQREITQEYELAETLAYQATHDWLTGLVNRYEFNQRLQASYERCLAKGEQAALCYIDLDQFKIVNDTAGHQAGDQLIAKIAQLLQSCIRESDILGRLGGDEFGLILRDCSLSVAQSICSSILSALRAYRFTWQGRQFVVGCSIGVVPVLDSSAGVESVANESDAMPVADGTATVVDLLSRADLACYKAKKLGRGRVYTDMPGEAGLESDRNVMTHIANIHQYLEEGRFFLVQQKIQPLSLAAHKGAHFEALIRFKESPHGVMTPTQFIPAMEQYGVITLIDRWVIETLLTQLPLTSTDALISINLSGISLGDESFLDYIICLIQQSTIPASCLCFEITETAAISHLNRAKCFIRTLQDMGVKFALDDFGSGVSSFGYLKSLPVDFLKIDGSLVRNMVSEPSDWAMVKSVNDIAHMLGMQTIAEFVEDQQTLECLTALGIDYAQGYGIEKPQDLWHKFPEQQSYRHPLMK